MDFFADPQKNAHVKAQNLMPETFFWSPIDEAGPFGSDAGADAAQGFSYWRKINPTVSPITYLSNLLTGWGLPLLDWNELDSSKILAFVQTSANLKEMDLPVDQLKAMLKNTSDQDETTPTDQALQDLLLNTAKNMGGRYLLEMDNAIIGTGFAQFVMEGKIETDLQYLTYTALKRQLLPVLIDRYDTSYKEIRKQMLTKMMAVVEKANL